MNCSEFREKDFESLAYKSKKLTTFFKRYNIIKNSVMEDFSSRLEKDNFSIYGSAGLRSSSLSFGRGSSSLQDKEFPSKLEYSLGIYAECDLPFRNGKWSIFIEPSFHHYTNDDVLEYQVLENDTITVNYKSFEIPIGLKWNVVLKENYKVFINPLFQLDISLDSKIDFTRGGSFLLLGSAPNLGFGIGTEIKEIIQLELQCFMPRDVLTQYIDWTSDYSVITAKLRIRVF